MEIDIFGTGQKKLVKKAVDVYNKQHKAISKNIANVNDPHYRRTKTDFSEELKEAEANSPLKSSHNKHITQPHYKATLFPQDRGEGKVEITQEMADLAENQIRNKFATKRLAGIFKKLQISIKGRM